jgi:hypothetical protein
VIGGAELAVGRVARHRSCCVDLGASVGVLDHVKVLADAATALGLVLKPLQLAFIVPREVLGGRAGLTPSKVQTEISVGTSQSARVVAIPKQLTEPAVVAAISAGMSALAASIASAHSGSELIAHAAPNLCSGYSEGRANRRRERTKAPWRATEVHSPMALSVLHRAAFAERKTLPSSSD